MMSMPLRVHLRPSPVRTTSLQKSRTKMQMVRLRWPPPGGPTPDGSSDDDGGDDVIDAEFEEA